MNPMKTLLEINETRTLHGIWARECRSRGVLSAASEEVLAELQSGLGSVEWVFRWPVQVRPHAFRCVRGLAVVQLS